MLNTENVVWSDAPATNHQPTAGMLTIPGLPPGTDTLTAALAYAASGWYVLPTKASDIKNPGSVVGQGWQHKSSRDTKLIAAWFAGTDHGIALHCGRSGVVVFDVDRPDKLPDVLRAHLDGAPYQATRPDQPGRGHYVFLQPPGRTLGNSTGRMGGDWGEVRGLNGVIVAAPTPHPAEGGCYRWERTPALRPVPAEVAELIDDASPASDAADDAQVADFIAAHTTAARPEMTRAWVTILGRRIEAGESCHASTVSALAGAMKEARAGYFSAAQGIADLKPVFVNAVALGGSGGNIRTGSTAEAEWQGILAWSVGQAQAADLGAVRARVDKKMPGNVEEVPAAPPAGDTASAEYAKPVSLAQAHAVFRRWLGGDYDTGALDAMLAAVAVERFGDGSDLIWLLLISGPGNAKTETVQALDGVGATVTSCISSEAALLSATPKRERAQDATGGLLRKLGAGGVLVVKDFTSILSMNRDLRARVLAALREIYDGRWCREVGTDGGRTIPWHGRIAVIGAVTTAWDTAHGVISAMGDRFVLVRIDSTQGRQRAGRQAIGNTGDELLMRAELAAAVAGVIAGMDTAPVTITDAETDVLLAAADLVTLARTGVEYDYRGDVIDAHAPEMPTRFAKQLAQIVRGAVALGMDRSDALRLAIRCARDSMPPLRLAIIGDLADHPHSSTSEVRRRINKPRNTVDRQLQALHALGVVAVAEQEDSGNGRSKWFYSLADGVEPDVLKPKSFPEMSVHTPIPSREEESKELKPSMVTDKSGNDRRSGCRYCGNAVTAGQLDADGQPAHPGCIPQQADEDVHDTQDNLSPPENKSGTGRRHGCICADEPAACHWCRTASANVWIEQKAPS
jgi:hypothetical protein